MTKQYVGYITAPSSKKLKNPDFDIHAHVKQQEQMLSNFLTNHNTIDIKKVFIELGDNKRSRHPFPELENAIQFAIEHKCILVIAHIHNLTSNRAFTQQIERYLNAHPHDPTFTPEIYCCDQPYIKTDNFKAIVSHSLQQKKMHGELIKAGLHRSSCKSGNPNAVNIINQVNRPKIDNAIIFALVLAPVVHYYQSKGLSQRQMVNQLNQDNFTAPEGGKWVLSQLQKVLSRIKINEAAIRLEKQITQYTEKGLTHEQMAEQFNSLSIPMPKGNEWTAELITTLQERIEQIQNIIEFHEFVIHLSPILEKYHIDDLNEDVFVNELQMANIEIPKSYYNQASDH